MKKLFSFLLALLLVFSVPIALCAPAAAEDTRRVAPFSSPALCADTGERIDLSRCDVQFAEGEAAVPGNKLTWKDADGQTVTSLTAPAAKGVLALTAADGTRSRTVYLVTKAPAESEYVLYENDFSSDPTADLRTVQKTSGASRNWDSAKGTLVLNASNAGDAYVRVLFPAWLDVFGDAVYEAELALSNPNGGNSRWGSLMFRVQNADTPYMQTCLRYGVSATNGMEISQRTEANKWNVIKTAAGSGFSASDFNRVRAEYAGGTVRYLVGGKEYLRIDSGYYNSGSVGLQVRGLTMTVDSVRLCVNPDAGAASAGMAGGFASVTLPASNISLSPSILAEVKTEEELRGVAEKGAAVALTEYTAAGIPLDGKTLTLEEGIAALQAKVIPAFRVRDAETAKALAAKLKNRDFRDAMLLVTDPSVYEAAYTEWNMLHGLWDASGFAGTAEEARYAAVAAGIRCVILPKALETRKDIAHLQDRYLVCYAFCDGTDVDAVRLCNLGISGLILPAASCHTGFLTEYYYKNTLTRYPNIIGHRGLPSTEQENSVIGCIRAYEGGACMVENDIHLSKDGVLMIMHDDTIDRTTTGTGTVTAMTKEQLDRYRINTQSGKPTEPIPTLEDYFETFRDNGKTIVIELKNSTTAPCKPLADMIAAYGNLDRVVVISFHEAPIRAMRALIPGISAAWLNSAITPNETAVPETLSTLLDTLQPLKAVYSPSYAKGALGPNLVGALFARGITTWAWTVNTQADFDRYFVAGTRGITTNYANWAGSYVKDLSCEPGENGAVTVRAAQYKGTVQDVTKMAVLRVVEDGGTGIRFDDNAGILHAEHAGTASVFFSYTAKTASGTSYATVTELMTVTAEENGTLHWGPAETQPGTDTAVPGTVPVAEKHGCGAALPLCAVWTAVLACPFVLRKKETRA